MATRAQPRRAGQKAAKPAPKKIVMKKAAPAKRPTKVRRSNTTPQRDESTLRKLEQITAKLEQARRVEQTLRDEQIDAMFDARNAGFSLREIGDAAGITNPRVHATLNRYAED